MNAHTLTQLATRAGIAPNYRDTWGRKHETSAATLRALLRAMGLPAQTDAQVATATQRLDQLEHTAVPPVRNATRAWQPTALIGDGRRWGLAVQLYGLRTPHTWGIGDFSALAELMHGAAALGACAVGINPLHALFPARPNHTSPYSPSSRRFLNPLYLDVEAMDDFATCNRVQAMVADTAFRARLHAVRTAPTVDYETVAQLKLAAFATLYDHFIRMCLNDGENPRCCAFRAFQARHGRPLRTFATFHALAQAHPGANWRQWPKALRDPDSPAVAAFAQTHLAAVEFHEYLQWQAAAQLQHVNEVAHAAGMGIGLFTDLAVGADPAGAECWQQQAFLADGATIGAPPDTLNLSGQNWGLPPPNPLALRRAAFAPHAELWQANMRMAGALRIDHVLALMRLYWIPAGASAADGAYVNYPWRNLLGLLAAQSRDNHCLVIGEDLGTVPDGLREALRNAGMLAYRLLVFEQHEGRFRPPHEYRTEALVAAGTHDLPPLPMWWRGEDIALRERLGLWPSQDKRNAEQVQRCQARQALTATLREAGLHAGDVPDHAPVEALYAFLARTPCKLLMVQPEDVLDVHTQTNVPGTTDAYPNWRARLPCTVDALLADPRMLRIAQMLREEGRADS